MTWTFQKAKQKVCLLVRCLTGQRPDFKEFLLSAPDLSILELERCKDLPREPQL